VIDAYLDIRILASEISLSTITSEFGMQS